ncbi:hypothetical protein YC2023_120579 [Brassica napus]
MKGRYIGEDSVRRLPGSPDDFQEVVWKTFWKSSSALYFRQLTGRLDDFQHLRRLRRFTGAIFGYMSSIEHIHFSMENHPIRLKYSATSSDNPLKSSIETLDFITRCDHFVSLFSFSFFFYIFIDRTTFCLSIFTATDL